MDDWSLLPSRNAAREPAPNPQSPTTTTTLSARLTHPRQAPTTSAGHPRPQHMALDPTGLARQPGDQSEATPRNPNNHGRHLRPPFPPCIRTSTCTPPGLDNTRPFMDDTGGAISGRGASFDRPAVVATGAEF